MDPAVATPVAERSDLPIVVELTPPPDRVTFCERLDGLPYRLLLDSATTDPRLGRYSFLSADPAIVVRAKGTRIEIVDRVQNTTTTVAGNALDVVRAILDPFKAAPVEGLPPFQGGVAGFIAYDWGHTLERLPAPRFDDIGLPDFVLGVFDWVVAWDHAASKAWLISTGIPATSPAARMARAAARAADVQRWLRSTTASSDSASADAGMLLDKPSEGAPSFPLAGRFFDPELGLRSNFTRDAYLAAVTRVREYIVAGDVFQVNVSQRIETRLVEHPWTFYRRLRVRNAAPFAAYLEFPGAAIASASPERFLQIDMDGRVETRPIKGTRPRGHGAEHDAALGLELTESAKDRSENLMIVDLMRNDLSRVCAAGSVRATELFALERYATVHHLVSTVVGKLQPDRDALHLIRAAFPGGSITGAPKVRAMEIIAEIEPSVRSVYCGSIGYWSVTGALDSSIAIRTALAVRDHLYFGAGGGIVADSDPEQEYLETLQKARGMIDALAVV